MKEVNACAVMTPGYMPLNAENFPNQKKCITIYIDLSVLFLSQGYYRDKR